MRVLAYIPLHYGAEYLDAAIRSVAPFVEKIMVLYVKDPSQSHSKGWACPEEEGQLRRIAQAASDKVEWHQCRFNTEGEHRGYVYDYAHGYDLVLAFDGDEVFEPEDLPNALDLAMKTDKRYIGIGGYVNFWKSFNYACYDGFTPIRITNLHNTGGEGVVPCRVYHFSTAQGEAIVRYKMSVSGHASEIRPDWLEKVYFAWTPENNFPDLHPVALGLWNATPFDKEKLPEILKAHPNFNKTVIE